MRKGNTTVKDQNKGIYRTVPRGSKQPVPLRKGRFGKRFQGSPDPIFRSDLLEYNPIERSGLLLPNHGFCNDPFINQFELIKIWWNLLKDHFKTEPIMVNDDATADDVLQLLHKKTSEMVGDYEWTLPE